jgi:hypothetical protein
MGWRDRDYAKWTDEERRRFYSSGATYPTRDPSPLRTGGGLLRPGAGLAALASLAIALGQLPLHHPLLPALHIGGTSAPPAPVSPVRTISGPSTAAVGSSLALHGTAPPGAVTVEGSYDAGRSWMVLATLQSLDGMYATQITLTQRGNLSIKVVYSDGSAATGSILVR